MNVRTVLDLNSGWEFHRGWKRRRWLGRPDGSGEIVDLPHCWNVREEFQPGVAYYRGTGSYARSFVPSADSLSGEANWELVAGGFVGAGDVWIDGERIAEVDGRSLGFRIDLTDRLEPSRPASVGVRLDTRHRALPLPGHPEPDFFIYGGLANGMWLERRPRLRVEEGSVRIEGQGVLGPDPLVRIEFEVTNGLERTVRPRIEWRLQDSLTAPAEGAGGDWLPLALEATDLPELQPGSAAGRHAVDIRLPAVRLWDPGDPHLYRAEAILYDGDGRVRDRVSLRFGLRELELRCGEGLFLNGRRLDLHGVNRSESLPGFGSALPRDLHRRDAVLLKKMGCNFVRLSHAPQSPDFLDACDELGLLVYAEVSSWKSVGTGRWLRAAREQMRALILRDRNRPSFAFWGLGNESRSSKAFVALREIVGELDPGRPTSYAENRLYRARRAGVSGIVDVWSVNYELMALEEARQLSRSGLTLVTECGREAQAQKGSVMERRQLDRLVTDWTLMEGHHHLCGYAVWSFADYPTLHRMRYRRRAGLVDAWRAPKLAAHLFAARYGSSPVLRLAVFPRSESEGSPEKPGRRRRALARLGTGPPALLGSGQPSPFRREVILGEVGRATEELRVITNYKSVEILADGVPLGVLRGAPHYVVPLPDASRTIEARGEMDGVEVVETWRRAGGARSIRIDREDLGPGLVDRDGSRATLPAAAESRDKRHLTIGETVAFEVHIVDSEGNPALEWNGRLVVSTEGLVRAHPYTAADEIQISGGEGRLFVTGLHRGSSVVRLEGAELEPASMPLVTLG